MLLDHPGRPLRRADVPVPRPGRGRVLLRVAACGICRTDLHGADGELREPARQLGASADEVEQRLGEFRRET